MKHIKTITDKFLPIFFAISIILGILGTILNKDSAFPMKWLVILFGTALTFFLAVKLENAEKLAKNITVKDYRKITAVLCVGLLIIQVCAVIFTKFTPINDILYVITGAKNLVLGDEIYKELPEYHRDYFECYPNNHMLTAIVYLLDKLEYSVSGNIRNILPTAVNIIGLNLSYLLMCLCAELVHTPERAFVCAVKGLLYTPFFTYAANFYTDAMALPYIMLAVYIYLRFRNNGKLPLIFICGAIVGLGFKMKGSAAVLFVAIILDMLLHKRKIIDYITFTAPFAAVCKAVSAISVKLLRLDPQLIEEKKFPFIHWIMMTADGRGGYVAEDFFYTQSFSADEKVAADLQKLGEKLNEQGVLGFIFHLFQKISYTWGNCTFMAGYYNPTFKNPIFFSVNFLFFYILVFSIFLRLWRERKKGKNEAFLFRLCLLGLCVFLLIWETRCRYLISFFPIFVLI